MSIPHNPINGLYLTTTPIQYDYNRYGGTDEFGTGFFFRNDDVTYLITNRHLVDVTTHNGERLKHIKIRIRPDPEDLTNTRRKELKIYDERSEGGNWIRHDQSSVDLAAIPLEPPITKNKINIPSHQHNTPNQCANIAFTLSDTPYEDSDLIIQSGSGAIILGCPPDPRPPFFPIARNATISTVYGQKHDNKPIFQTDAASHAGLSGSPVLTPPMSPLGLPGDKKITAGIASELMDDSSWHLIGIHSGVADIRQDLDLNNAYYSTLLKDILDK